MALFKKVLIANRGEIARRVIRTCKKLGISTVAIYSEADQDAPFVREADESYLLGPAHVNQSYMNADKIIEIIQKAGVDAVHPGYGFMSENTTFAERCREVGVTFIGPRPEVIRLMGSKLESRNLMKRAGVPVVPGCDGAISDLDEALHIANQIGYPVMLKASAGGGGIGMQEVHNDTELEKVFTSTQQRAAMYFGNGEVFIEKRILHPRHIEVQVVCDHHGNALHLFERECSIQRRNQKVIEESPSPFLTVDLRKQLTEAAVTGAKSIGYTNVGTMEFIFDEKGNFYFLEMNTRLQVEHPVTEEITGLDLVQLQLEIAADKPLTITQETVLSQGHALECRLYAEDPKTFYPSPGTITKLVLPNENVRLDFSVVEGNKVSSFYDPMIGKIITHGLSRREAIHRMIEVLKSIKIEGLKTNLSLLLQVCEHATFQEGKISTQFIQEYILNQPSQV
jgi:acetyl-CoA carboxylase, biotin carboxylase subunit